MVRGLAQDDAETVLLSLEKLRLRRDQVVAFNCVVGGMDKIGSDSRQRYTVEGLEATDTSCSRGNSS